MPAACTLNAEEKSVRVYQTARLDVYIYTVTANPTTEVTEGTRQVRGVPRQQKSEQTHGSLHTLVVANLSTRY
jgi:hypothetical protein